MTTVLLAAGGLSACGDSGSGDDARVKAKTGPTRSELDGRWSKEKLRAPMGVDLPTQIGVDGDDVVIPFVGDDGVLTGYASEDGRAFEKGESVDTGLRFFGFAGVARVDGRWLAVGSGGLEEVDGDDEQVFEVHVFESEDGRAWREVDATGLEEPADVTGVAAIDSDVVAVGSFRGADDPGRRAFGATAWRSGDGRSWTEIELPAANLADGASYGGAIVAVGERLLVTGRAGKKGVVWTSTDAGRTWSTVSGLPGVSSWSHLAAVGETVVLSGVQARATSDESDGGRELLLRSTDGGETWGPVKSPPPPNRGESFALPLWASGDRFFTTTSSFIEAFREPELCYADITLCQADSSVALYASNDGDRWERVDTSGIGEGEEGEVGPVLGTAEGRVLALRAVFEEGFDAFWWPAGVELPTEGEPVDPTTEVDLLGDEEQPEVGHRYAAPLHIHCGMDWLYLGGTPWKRTDQGTDVETGAGTPVPKGWPVAQQTIFGFVELTSPDEAEYSIDDGKVIATYERTEERPPGCA